MILRVSRAFSTQPPNHARDELSVISPFTYPSVYYESFPPCHPHLFSHVTMADDTGFGSPPDEHEVKAYHSKRPHKKSRKGCKNCKTRKVRAAMTTSL